jgi:MFS family permease
MLAGSAVMLGAANIALATAMVSWVVLCTSFFLGVSSAVVNTTGMVYFAESATVDRRGRSMAGFSAALLGGQALGPAVGGVLASFSGWRAALVISGLLGVLAAGTLLVRAWFTRREVPVTASEEAPTDAEDPRHHVPVREQAILYFVPFAMFFAFGSMPQTLVPIIGADEFELSVGVIGLALGIGGGCRFIGAVIGGIVSDRVSRKAALIPGTLAQAAGVALLALEGSLWAWGAAIVVMSVASFSIAVAATMLVDRSHGRRAGRRLGPFRFAGDLGLIAGPITASIVYEQFGQRPAALLVVGVLLASAAAAAFGLRETRWPPGPPDKKPATAGSSGLSGGES